MICVLILMYLIETVVFFFSLKAIRAKVWTARTESPLFDCKAYATGLEMLYASMWARHARGERPDHIQAVDKQAQRPVHPGNPAHSGHPAHPGHPAHAGLLAHSRHPAHPAHPAHRVPNDSAKKRRWCQCCEWTADFDLNWIEVSLVCSYWANITAMQ